MQDIATDCVMQDLALVHFLCQLEAIKPGLAAQGNFPLARMSSTVVVAV